MRFITISAAVLLGSAVSAVNAQQLREANPAPSKTTTVTKSQGGVVHQQAPIAPGTSIFVSGGSETCATATMISGAGLFLGDNIGAVMDGPAPSCRLTAVSNVWYEWTALASGLTTISTCPTAGGAAAFDSVIAVYDTAACTGAELVCNDDGPGCTATFESTVVFNATMSNVYKIQIAGWSAGEVGAYSLNISAPMPPVVGDSCAAPFVYGGGVVPWTNVGATTDGGAEGCGTPTLDVWYSWNATCTGLATFTLCPGGELAPDTVIAAYSGSGCPTPGTAIGCDDDTCSSPAFGTSRTTFAVTSGQPYLLRIGGFGGATGSGNFEVTCFTPPAPGPCDVFDDGSTEDSVGTNNPAHDILWMHSQGDAALTTVVNSISTAWGSTGGAFGPPDGTPARVGIWSDPNGDGNPTDAVVIQEVATVVAGTGTDALQVVTLTTPVVVTGKYFIGASCTGGTFSAPLDQSSGAGLGRVWIVGSTVGLINYAALAGEEIPPTDEDTVAPGFWLLRGDCKDFGIEEICAADGSNCPCGNNGPGPGGCVNSVPANAGAHLTASGNASVSADTLAISASGVRKGNPTTAIFFAGTQAAPSGVFDGLLCAGNPLLRLWKWKTPGPGGGEITLTGPDASNFPPMGAPPAGTSISAETAAIQGLIAPGRKIVYQVWYRDPSTTHGCVTLMDTSNYSNALLVTWAP